MKIFRIPNSIARFLPFQHMLASACVNITFNGNKTFMDEYLNRMSTKIAEIGAHVDKWSAASLVSLFLSVTR